MTDGEKGRGVPGFEDRYEVSDAGRVRSLDHEVPGVAQGTPFMRPVKGRVLAPNAQASGHLYVFLGRRNRRQVHRLVLEAFVGPCPDGHEGLHMNHDPKDNRLANLKWGTRSENLRMDYAAGARKTHPNFNRWGRRFD